MDVKGLFDESALPTMQQVESTGTVAAPLPSVTVTKSGIWKFGLSTVAGVLGMYYLAAGKKENDVEKMVIGAVLTIVSLFLF